MTTIFCLLLKLNKFYKIFFYWNEIPHLMHLYYAVIINLKFLIEETDLSKIDDRKLQYTVNESSYKTMNLVVSPENKKLTTIPDNISFSFPTCVSLSRLSCTRTIVIGPFSSKVLKI